MGKASPKTLPAVLQTFVDFRQKFISKHIGATDKPLGQCAAALDDQNLSWEATMQRICDICFGLDCNGFVGNWLMLADPSLKLNYNCQADDLRRKAVKVRTELDQIEDRDVMCYAANEHVAAIQGDGKSPGTFLVCQSAGGGPRMNEYRFLSAGSGKFKLAAPTALDIGSAFYVVSLW